MLESPQGEATAVYVNPYTGTIIGSRMSDRTFMTFTLKIYEQLLASETGTQIIGVAALLLFILSLTGIILWPGWRKLISGFKIKWKNAHPKRVNFDIHKVVGIIAAVFLTFTRFTGFYLNCGRVSWHKASGIQDCDSLTDTASTPHTHFMRNYCK